MVKFRMRLIDAVKLKQDDAEEVFECSMFDSFHPVSFVRFNASLCNLSLTGILMFLDWVIHVLYK